MCGVHAEEHVALDGGNGSATSEPVEQANFQAVLPVDRRRVSTKQLDPLRRVCSGAYSSCQLNVLVVDDTLGTLRCVKDDSHGG